MLDPLAEITIIGCVNRFRFARYTAGYGERVTEATVEVRSEAREHERKARRQHTRLLATRDTIFKVRVRTVIGVVPAVIHM